MRPNYISKRMSTAIVLAFTFIFALTQSAVLAAPAPQTSGPLVATVTELLDLPSDVLIRPVANSPEIVATIGQPIQVGGTVRTLGRGYVKLTLSNGSIIRLSPKSSFTLTSMDQSGGGLTAQINLLFGKVWVILTGGSMEVKTPTGVAAIKGSYLSVDYGPDWSYMHIQCAETTGNNGNCALQIGGTIYLIPSGFKATMPPNDLSQLQRMSAGDFLEWSKQVPEANNPTVLPIFVCNIVFSGNAAKDSICK